MAGINKELWTREIQQRFREQNTGLIPVLRNFSAYVGNEAVHIPQGAGDVTIKKNIDQTNANFKADNEKRGVTDLTISLDRYFSNRVILPDQDQDYVAIDIRRDNTQNIADSLATNMEIDAIVDIVPATAGNRITKQASGTEAAGVKSVTAEDFINMAVEFDKQKIPYGNRYVLLHTNHLANLLVKNIELYNQINVTNSLYGFTVVRSESIVGFNKANGNVKKTSPDSYGSVFFHGNTVGKAMGPIKMFMDNDSAEIYGSAVSARATFKAFNLRPEGVNCGVGVLYS